MRVSLSPSTAATRSQSASGNAAPPSIRDNGGTADPLSTSGANVAANAIGAVKRPAQEHRAEGCR
ncbi:hypothetical protein GCM10022402_34620 [Salinactinospora qingdaonensis]|uniref:Uncharacterized protein n=1 Tax=Salinactinospora qingdaonensis TaxID=702744 RepID=A0ABP7G2R3_9ACTN